MAFIAMILSVPLHRLYARNRMENRQQALLDSFRDVLYSISSSVSAGRRMPLAIEEACSNVDGDMKKELLRIAKEYKEAHADIAEALKDLGLRSGVEEIELFADSYAICESCGADLETVCLKSAALLLDRIAYQREVKALTAQKRLDMMLLTSMPLAVLLLLNLIAYSYIEPLYSGLSGRLAMTLCLGLIASALLWGMKIVSLKL